jgi:UDP-glucose 4-epimerase
MKKVLVTGGLGFVGSNLVDLLLDKGGYDVTVMDNLSSESASRTYMRNDVKYWIDDIRNINSYKYVNEKFDTVFHLAALSRIQPSFDAPLDTLSININGTACVLEFARQCGANVVYAGSSSAYAGPMLNPYAYAKYTGEQVCEMYAKVYGMNTVTARFFNVYGERQPTAGAYATVVGIFERQRADNTPLTVTGTGEQRRDFTHVSDIVKGLVALSECQCQGEVYNLGTGTNHSINELAVLFKPTEIKHIPPRPGEAWMTLADISETTCKSGWKPATTLENYVGEFIGKLQTNKG